MFIDIYVVNPQNVPGTFQRESFLSKQTKGYMEYF